MKDLEKGIEDCEVQESGEYENCMDLLDLDMSEVTLDEFIEVEGQKEDEDDWKKYWVGMPEYNDGKEKKFKSLTVHFLTEDDFNEFVKLMNQTITDKTKFIYYPAREKDANSLNRWIEE